MQSLTERLTVRPDLDEGTAGSALVRPQPAPQTADRAVDPLIQAGLLRTAASQLRDRVQLLTVDVDDLHHETQAVDLDEQARAKARKSVPSLLAELAGQRGLSWTDIARLIGVSVSAVRKWRTEGGAAPEKRLSLARLAAFLDLLEGFSVEDPAQWLEMPLVDGYTVTALDLYQDEHIDVLLDYADTRLSAEQALDSVRPDWRQAYRSEFEVYDASDGNKGIRRRSR